MHATFAVACATLLGCAHDWKAPKGPLDTKKSYYDSVATRIEYPDVADANNAASGSAISSTAPFALQDPSQLPSWELSLDDAVQIAIGSSPVIRNLGGSIVSSPQTTTTIFDPALIEANPLGGVEAALADFDAQFAGQLFWQKNDQPRNIDVTNPILSAFQRAVFQQTFANYAAEVSKRTASGALFSARQNVSYDRPNTPNRGFSSDFDGYFEAEYRQPLMRGRGVEFNRIAGPNSPVGQYNGVLIARVNTDISVTNFEASVVQLASDVEQAYWALYYAYRNLEAQLRGRESALQAFQYQELRLKVGAGRSDEEAQARSQFYQFQVQVENGLAGEEGLYKLEQRLRYLLGLPASDGRLIKPITDPMDTRVVFDWSSALSQSLERRVEIRRQKWNVKKRELELIASRMNKRPQLDFLGQYRWRGLGDNLIGNGNGYRDNLYSEIAGGNHQEWQAGLEMSFPIGLRKASVAISHANLNLARERALLGEVELRVSHDVADATREVQRQYQLLRTTYNRWIADRRQLEVLRERYLRGADNINFLLQAQRTVVTSESQYYLTRVAYNIAIRDLHKAKGTLLAYNHIQLAEGGWNREAYGDAYERGRCYQPAVLPDLKDAPRPLSRGEFDPSLPATTAPMTLDQTPESSTMTLPAPVALSPRIPMDVSDSSAEVDGQLQEADPILLPAAPNDANIEQVSF